MYCVCQKKTALLAVGILLTACIVLLGLAGHTMHTAAEKRELPIYSVETPEKKLALGINCAWDNSDIAMLLSLLDAHHIRATFFVVGDWCGKYPESVKQIADAGQELGSHSDTHPDMTKLTREQITAQLERSKEKIETASGQKIHLFRPPSGAYNNLVVSTARAEGWEVIQWSNDSLDWKGLSTAEIVTRVTKKAASGDILLFHAGKPNTPAALEQIIAQLCAEGYQFVPVSELIHSVPYTIDHTGRQFSNTKGRH